MSEILGNMKNKDCKQYRSYLVRDENILYEIADQRLLHFIEGVAPDRENEGKYLWFFQKDTRIKKIIDENKISINELFQEKQIESIERDKHQNSGQNTVIYSCPIGVDEPMPKDADGKLIGLTRCKRIELCTDVNILREYACNRNSKDTQYRIAAVKALSTIYTREAGDILRHLTSDPDWKVKKYARKKLKSRNNEIKKVKISNGTWVE